MTEPDHNQEPSPTRRDEDLLEAFFAAGRAGAPAASGALLARITADAARVQAERQAKAATRAVPQRRTAHWGWRSRLAALRAQLGGGLAVGGLALATLVGVWIGAQPPELLLDMESRLFGEVIVIEFAEDFWGLEDI